MKLLFIHATLLLASAVCFGQDLEHISTAFKQSDAGGLASHFNTTTELTILTTEQAVDQAKGENLLRNFFREHPAAGFDVLHKGVSKNGVQYAIGQLKSNGKNFRVSIYMKDANGTVRIDNLQIEEE